MVVGRTLSQNPIFLSTTPRGRLYPLVTLIANSLHTYIFCARELRCDPFANLKVTPLAGHVCKGIKFILLSICFLYFLIKILRFF